MFILGVKWNIKLEIFRIIKKWRKQLVWRSTSCWRKHAKDYHKLYCFQKLTYIYMISRPLVGINWWSWSERWCKKSTMNLSTICQQRIPDMFPVIAAVCSVVDETWAVGHFYQVQVKRAPEKLYNQDYNEEVRMIAWSIIISSQNMDLNCAILSI